MKKLLLFLCCTLISTVFYAQITISGSNSFCSLTTESYLILGDGELTISVYGGIITSLSCVSNCNENVADIERNLNGNPATVNYDPENTARTGLGIAVAWNNNSTQNHRIKVTSSINPSVTRFIQIHNSNNAYVNGPKGLLCQSYTGGTYRINNLQPPYTVTWSGTNSSGGALSFSSPTNWSTYISGFSPGSLHSINAQIRCNGVLKRTVSATVVTGAGCRIYMDDDESELFGEALELALEEELTKPNEAIEDNFDNLITSPISLSKDIKIFPNPIRNGQVMNFKIPENLEVENIVIRSSNGQIVKNIVAQNRLDMEIETSTLSPGYVLCSI